MEDRRVKSKQHEDFNKRYTEDELKKMSLHELRSICVNYKIIIGMAQQSMNKDYLINLVLKYRGVEEKFKIDFFSEGGFERVQDMLLTKIAQSSSGENKIKIPAKISLYRDTGVSKADEYKTIISDDIDETVALLVNGNNYLCGIFYLEQDENDRNKYFILAKGENLLFEELKNKNYSILFFRKGDSRYIYRTYTGAAENTEPFKLVSYKVELGDLAINELQETNMVLCIDFGTSNTTAGCYPDSHYIGKIPNNEILNKSIVLNEVNFVRFLEKSDKGNKWAKMVPTTVYVNNCADSDNVKYLFGYEAKEKVRENNYCTKATLFHGIKRWISSPEQTEDIQDEKGNFAVVQRKEIIREYMNYVIKTAEAQFKCRFRDIHVSGPVKMKNQFIGMFKEIITDYNILEKDVLDEGIAVLYNTIANRIDSGRFRDGEEYKALVIDCGGGTTDLASCFFSIEEGDISYKVNIRTTYENGDTNFGGNNITFRIMQFMKILFAGYYTKSEIIDDIDSLITAQSEDIFRTVDDEGVDYIYKVLEKKYKEAEMIIPTKYKEYENKPRDEYEMVKNNFFFMWELADEMKKQFFRKTNILRSRFDSKLIDDKDSDMQVTRIDRWNLSVFDNGKLRGIDKFPEVTFNIKEINKLIKGDIYNIVRKFLEKFYETRELSDYSIIKLTGQSCKIDTFKEALKEFVPGKSIEFKQSKNIDDDSAELKLSCLRGVVRYISSKKQGNIEVEIINETPTIPYSISAKEYNGKERIIVESYNKIEYAIGNITKPKSVSEFELFLKDGEGKVIKVYNYRNEPYNYKEMDVDEILEELDWKITQDDTDTIKDNTTKFFIFVDDESWGFFVVPVSREDEVLYIGEKNYFPFEEELSNLTFFDGLK